MAKSDSALLVLNVLMRADKPLTTKEIHRMTGCDRKLIYAAADRLELAGFPIIVTSGADGLKTPNTYEWSGQVLGFGE